LDRVREEPSAAYIIMAYAAAHRADSGLSNRSRDLGLAADYKAKCFALVNSRLQTASGIHKASDQNIQAVLLLLAYETRYGNAQDAVTHLNGLRGMIQERGGLRVFEEQVTLRHQLFWVQITGTAATILDCAPFCGYPGIPTAPEAPLHTWSRIFLAIPVQSNEFLCQSFIHRLRQFRSHDHVSVLRGVFGPVAATYQIASATLENIVPPTSTWGHLLSECRLACLFYINALIFTSYNSVQRAKDVLYDTVVLHFGVDYPTSESPLGLLWVFLYSLQLTDERNKDTLRIVIDMMQAARLLRVERLDMVGHVLLQLLFHPNKVVDACLYLNETDVVNDIMR
jgi:hypothetical protein